MITNNKELGELALFASRKNQSAVDRIIKTILFNIGFNLELIESSGVKFKFVTTAPIANPVVELKFDFDGLSRATGLLQSNAAIIAYQRITDYVHLYTLMLSKSDEQKGWYRVEYEYVEVRTEEPIDISEPFIPKARLANKQYNIEAEVSLRMKDSYCNCKGALCFYVDEDDEIICSSKTDSVGEASDTQFVGRVRHAYITRAAALMQVLLDNWEICDLNDAFIKLRQDNSDRHVVFSRFDNSCYVFGGIMEGDDVFVKFGYDCSYTDEEQSAIEHNVTAAFFKYLIDKYRVDVKRAIAMVHDNGASLVASYKSQGCVQITDVNNSEDYFYSERGFTVCAIAFIAELHDYNWCLFKIKDGFATMFRDIGECRQVMQICLKNRGKANASIDSNGGDISDVKKLASQYGVHLSFYELDKIVTAQRPSKCVNLNHKAKLIHFIREHIDGIVATKNDHVAFDEFTSLVNKAYAEIKEVSEKECVSWLTAYRNADANMVLEYLGTQYMAKYSKTGGVAGKEVTVTITFNKRIEVRDSQELPLV